MSKTIPEQFKDNIPAALRNNELILNYAEAIGEVFEEIRQDINYKAFETDYAKSRYLTFDDVTSNIGLKLSPFIKEDVTRRLIRDMPDIYTKLGTRGSLEWALKTLGYRSYEIDEAWVPNPDQLRLGYYRPLLSTDAPVRYNVRPRSYIDFVVGEEYVTEQGTFFKGFSYSDFEKENEINGIPIYGEGYSTYTGLSFKDMVSKTPYIIARLYSAPLYEEVITDIDPSTGEPVNLTVQEKQKIITDSIRYLIQNLQRTATVSIILVTDLLLFTDIVFRPVDALQITMTSNMLVESDNTPQILDAPLENNARLASNNISKRKIGAGRPIGIVSPFAATGEYLFSGKVGFPSTLADRNIEESIRRQNQTTVVKSVPSGYVHAHFLDYDADVSFITPPGVNVTVHKVRNFHYSDQSDWEFIATISGGNSFNQTISDSHAVVLTFNNGLNGTLNISSTYT